MLISVIAILCRQPRSLWVFLFLGILLRLWHVSAPIVDSMTPRQTQTADAIRSLIEEPGFQLDSNVSWRGTGNHRIVQELPVYSLTTQVVYEALAMTFFPVAPPKPGGADPHLIDISGRLVSVAFWVLAFVLSQCIWLRFLTLREMLFANSILVFAPLSVFCGQAVMPEMVFLALATGFVVGALNYADKPDIRTFSIVFFCGLLACIVKLPAFSHLVLLAMAVFWRKQGGDFLFRPVHWIAAALALAALKGWGNYVTEVNAATFPEWTSESSLRSFLGDPAARLQPGLYIKIAGYITAFLLSPIGVVFAGTGLWQAWKRRVEDTGFFALAWIGSLIFYVLVWGVQTAGAQNYYNLPMLIPGAMLFGMGFEAFFTWMESKRGRRLAVTVAVAAAILVLAPMAFMEAYLFREDRILMSAAQWIRQNVPSGRPVAVKLNHTPFYIDYMHVPAVAYYSGHPCFMLSRYTPTKEYDAAMKECDVIVETLPVALGSAKDFAVKFKGAERPVDHLEKAKTAGFAPGKPQESGIRIWTRPE